MAIIQGRVTLQPSLLMRRMSGVREVSEGSRHELIARLRIMGHWVRFYRDGAREIETIDLDEHELEDSQLLRFAHASFLTRQPIGDRRMIYADATKHPVEVWFKGREFTR